MNQARALALHQKANEILKLTYDFGEVTQLMVTRKAIPLAEQSKFQEFASNTIQTQRDELPRRALKFAIIKGPKIVKFIAKEVDWKQLR